VKNKKTKKVAKSDEIIPFFLKWETGLGRYAYKLPLEKMFEEARKTGYGNDPDDLGGATMCGVILSTYRTYCKNKGLPTPGIKELKAIPYAQWREIAKAMFWDKWQADKIASQAVANILVDWVWASGKYGITLPQKLLGVTADGIVGPKTLAALNAREPRALFAQLRQARINFIESICAKRPANKKFRRGWLNRIDGITYNGLVL
jgi:lysozyme family protein